MELEEQSEPEEAAVPATTAASAAAVGLEEDTFESLQSEVESEEMHDAETGSSPERVESLEGLDVEQQQQVLMDQGEAAVAENAQIDPLLVIESLLEDDAMPTDELPQLQVAVVPEPPQAPQAVVDAQDEAAVRMEDDYEDAYDGSSSSSDISLTDESPGRYQRGNLILPVSRVNEAIRRLIARDDASGATLADLLDQDTFMQRLRRLLFSLDHDRVRMQRNLGTGGEGDGEIDAAGAGEGVAREDSGSHSLDGELVHEGGEAEEALDDERSRAQRIEDEEAENSVRFDTNLAAEHSYLGANMNRVSGVNYLEEGQQYNLMLFMHQHMLFPGEVLPFMISESIIEADIDAQNGLLFGVCFPFLSSGTGTNDNGNVDDANSEKDDNIYGVTCQIYEKGTDARGNILIKSRALQRFVTKASGFTSPPQFITAHPQLKSYGFVKILPEIFLREPLKCIDMGAMNRFRDIASMQQTYKRFQAASTPWPVHVYDYYSITAIIEKARSQLAQHKIDTMPTDPVQLSFWLVRNLHLSEGMMKTIFMMDCVNNRLKMIAGTFKQDAMFTCRYCGNRIANCRELFAMSKHGVQTQYCNSAGYIHETNTVYQLLRDAVRYSGEPSTEFSWFPGYKWHIVVCRICSRHIGWEFKALEQNLVPKSFFGISSSSVHISTHAANPRDVIFQNFMRLVQREMH